MTTPLSTLSRADLEAMCADQAARLARILELLATQGIYPQVYTQGESDEQVARCRFAEFDGVPKDDALDQDDEAPTEKVHSIPKKITDDREDISDPDVVATLRALGCDMHEARRLARVATGKTPEARVSDALRRRG